MEDSNGAPRSAHARAISKKLINSCKYLPELGIEFLLGMRARALEVAEAPLAIRSFSVRSADAGHSGGAPLHPRLGRARASAENTCEREQRRKSNLKLFPPGWDAP
jgi:hypothetical protein